MTEKSLYNIHEILNDFEQHFPYKRISTKISHIYESMILIEVQLPPKRLERLDTKWNKYIDTDVILQEQHENYYMLKLWIHRDQRGSFEQPSDWELILFKDNIYTNPYVMPDPDVSQAFFRAKETWMNSLADKLFTQYKIKLSDRQLAQTRKKAEHVLHLHLKDLKTEKQLKRFIKNKQKIVFDLEALEFLYCGPYGSGTDQDKDFPEQWFYPDFNKYNKSGS